MGRVSEPYAKVSLDKALELTQTNSKANKVFRVKWKLILVTCLLVHATSFTGAIETVASSTKNISRLTNIYRVSIKYLKTFIGSCSSLSLETKRCIWHPRDTTPNYLTNL